MSKKNHINVESNVPDSNFVAQLIDAEKRARDIIEAAKKRKLAKTKKARDLALTETESFKSECESKLAKFVNNQGINKNATSNAFAQQLSKKTNDLKSAFEKNKKTVIQFIINKVMDVTVEPHENLRFD